VPGGVVTLGDDRVHAGLDLALCLARLADQAEDQHVAGMRRVEQERRAAEPGGDDGHSLVEHDVELRAGELLVEAAPRVEGDGALRRGNVILLLDVARELPMALGDLRLEVVERARRRRGRRQEQVDAEGLAVDSLPDPRDVRGDVVGGVHGFTEHREPAGVDHCDGDVLAVGERDDRVLDAQQVTELRPQRILGHGVVLLVDGPAFDSAVVTNVALRPGGSNT